MSNLTYIYKKENNKIKLLDSLNYTLEEFKNNPIGCYPDWNTSSMTASESKYEYPIIDETTQELRDMTKYEKFKNNLYELQYNEVEHNKDILTLEAGQYIKNNELITVEKLEGTWVEWNWETHVWEEKASDLEIVEAQYRDYSAMDTPSTVQEMKLEDEAMAEEFLTLLIDLRGIIYNLKIQETEMFTSRVVVPEPSTALKNFKNKFKLTR